MKELLLNMTNANITDRNQALIFARANIKTIKNKLNDNNLYPYDIYITLCDMYKL